MNDTLNNVPINQSVIVKNICCQENIKRRLLDLGIVENTMITPIFRSPTDDSTAFEVRGSVISLRQDDSSKIFINKN